MIFLPILRLNLSSFSTITDFAPAPGPPEPLIFLRNFNDFPPHTEGELKLILYKFARWLAPQDH